MGSFYDCTGVEVCVCICVSDGQFGTRQIGVEPGADGDSGLWFSGSEAVVVESEVNDSLDTLVQSSCVIKLLARGFDGDLWQGGPLDASVVVRRGGRLVWCGFVAPMTWEQGFVDVLEPVEVHCVDVLGALSWLHYGGVESEAQWKQACSSAVMVSFERLVMCAVQPALDVLGENPLWGADDGDVVMHVCRGLAGGAGDSDRLLWNLEVDERVVLGDDFGDVWTLAGCLEVVARWLGMQVVCDGGRVVLWDWLALSRGAVKAVSVLHGGVAVADLVARDVELTVDLAGSAEARLSVGESWNRVRLESSMEEIDVVIEGPTDGGERVWSRGERVVREYLGVKTFSGDMNKRMAAAEDAQRAVNEMLNASRQVGSSGDGDGVSSSDCALKTDWWVRVLENEQWRLPGSEAVVESARGDVTGQHLVPWEMSGLRGKRGAWLAEIASEELNPAAVADIRVHRLEWRPALIVGVNGDGDDRRNNHKDTRPSERALLDMVPVAVFEGGVSVCVSPPDDGSVNYIVIKGSVELVPVMMPSTTDEGRNSYVAAKRYANGRVGSGAVAGAVLDDDEHGTVFCAVRRYFRLKWPQVRVGSTNEWVDDVTGEPVEVEHDAGNGTCAPHGGWVPPVGGGKVQQFKYERNADGTTVDKQWKIPVLACMLVVGDKVCVELDGGRVGLAESFVWRDFKRREDCASDAEFYEQCIYIGFNPGIGDYIVGVQHDVMNNVRASMGIDADGMAIPVRASDGVSGRVRFEVLGPVDVWHEGNVYTHSTWFRHSSVATDYVRVLPHVSSVVLRDFSVGVVSSLRGDDAGGKLVWLSETGDGFSRELVLDELPVVSGLSSAECRELGVGGGVRLGTVLCNGTGVLRLHEYGADVDAKAEQIVVDRAWEDVHRPRVELEFDADMDGVADELWRVWHHGALPGKRLRVMSRGWDLQAGTVHYRVREL